MGNVSIETLQVVNESYSLWKVEMGSGDVVDGAMNPPAIVLKVRRLLRRWNGPRLFIELTESHLMPMVYMQYLLSCQTTSKRLISWVGP